MSKIKIFKILPVTIIFGLMFLVYSPLIGVDQLVDPDAQIIIENLKLYGSFSDYIVALFEFRTIDFQPLRDLTLKLDIVLFEKFAFNTFGLQNIIWWCLSCFTLFRISRFLNKAKEDYYLLILILCFAAYPLFSFIVSWGMARKHLLALFFILLATYDLIRTENSEKKSIGQIFKISFWYMLSLLSQPIHILWPVWALLYSRAFNKLSWRTILTLFSPAIVTLGSIGLLNFIYYNSSQAFLSRYAAKITDITSLGDKLLAAGHYHFQLFFPYLKAFNYSLGDNTVLYGFFIFLVFAALIYKLFSKYRHACLWLGLGYLSLFMMLSDTNQLYDTYLLLPACSLFILASMIMPDKIDRRVLFVLSSLVLIWGLLSNQDSKLWLNPVSLTKASFENRPNCRSAISFLKMSYESFLPGPVEAKKYIEENECFQRKRFTAYTAASFQVISSSIMFHENDFELTKRLEFLQKMGEKNPFIKLTYAALLIREKRFIEADTVITEIIQKNPKIAKNQFHAITANVVDPYCQKKKWHECRAITSKVSKKPKLPYI